MPKGSPVLSKRSVEAGQQFNVVVQKAGSQAHSGCGIGEAMADCTAL